MNEVAIASGARTPAGDFLGSLKDLNCAELGIIALKAVMEQAKVDTKLIEEVVCGNDGAAALVIMSLDKTKRPGINTLARIVDIGSAEVDAKIMGMGVVPSVKRTLHFANLKIEDIDYWEINQAFAAQLIGCNRELKIPLDKMNINGGGTPLDHPVGMTGAPLIVSLLQEMIRRGVLSGGASPCGGGGPSTSIIMEKWEK
jgi:acetyl-CoA C-acetyltransferase